MKRARVLAALGLALLAAAPEARAACPPLDHTHAQWSALLARRVEHGRIDYAGIAREERAALDAYLAALSATCAADRARWSEAQKLAFWINAYNAFTVKLILEHWPLGSIREIGWWPGAAFRTRFIPMDGLEGGALSLDAIEHDTLRRDFREPRIHFALVCAARSCPPLRAEAYRAADLEHQLDDQGRAFLGDPRKNRVDAARRTLLLSKIFDWFREDFERASGSLPAFVAPYLPGAAALGADARVEFLDYDWRLNDRSAE